MTFSEAGVLVIVLLLTYQSFMLMRIVRRLLTLESALDAMWTWTTASSAPLGSTSTDGRTHAAEKGTARAGGPDG